LFKQDSITVQRYNSLAVRFDDEELKKKADHLYWCQNELIMSKGNSFLTYQFHPESVGTTYPETFFKPLSALLI
jgi:anthranilate/para-aminobenzoate synthase component II